MSARGRAAPCLLVATLGAAMHPVKQPMSVPVRSLSRPPQSACAAQPGVYQPPLPFLAVDVNRQPGCRWLWVPPAAHPNTVCVVC